MILRIINDSKICLFGHPDAQSLVEKRTKELGEANLALQKANRKLQRSNAQLEEFAYAASHDLKEPVRKIHVFTTQFKEQLSAQLSEGQAKTFSRIKVLHG